MEEDHKNEGYGSIVLVTRKNIQRKTRKYERTEKKKILRKNSHCVFLWMGRIRKIFFAKMVYHDLPVENKKNKGKNHHKK